MALLLMRTYSSDEAWDDDIGVACVSLTGTLARLAFARRKLVLETQAKDANLCLMEFLDSRVTWLRLKDVPDTNMQAALYTERDALLDEVWDGTPKLLDDNFDFERLYLEDANMQGVCMQVTSSEVKWEGSVKHTSVRLATDCIPYEKLEQYLGEPS